jgi:hypothetical protein
MLPVINDNQAVSAYAVLNPRATRAVDPACRNQSQLAGADDPPGRLMPRPDAYGAALLQPHAALVHPGRPAPACR